MKIRQLKKYHDLRMVVENAHDVAVAKQVLLSITLMLDNKKFEAVTFKDPFFDETLNCLWQNIYDKLHKEYDTGTNQ